MIPPSFITCQNLECKVLLIQKIFRFIFLTRNVVLKNECLSGLLSGLMIFLGWLLPRRAHDRRDECHFRHFSKNDYVRRGRPAEFQKNLDRLFEFIGKGRMDQRLFTHQLKNTVAISGSPARLDPFGACRTC